MQDFTFDAEGVSLSGWVMRPPRQRTHQSGPAPVIVLSHGLSAVKAQHIPRFARAFAEAGFVCLAYDHRNFGASGGAPRQEADPWRQVRDMRIAISHARALEGVDPERLGLWGTSYSGGHVLSVAARDARVKCVVSQAPITHGYATLTRSISPEVMTGLRAWIAQDADGRARGEAPVMVNTFEPGEEGWDCLTADREATGYDPRLTLQSRDMIFSYAPAELIAQIAPTPLFMVIADTDVITPTALQEQAFAQAGEPTRLHVIRGARHFDVYERHFDEASTVARDWFVEHLKP
jgi:fermentation-respiration switch protein FrsA (DUF1100 family)